MVYLLGRERRDLDQSFPPPQLLVQIAELCLDRRPLYSGMLLASRARIASLAVSIGLIASLKRAEDVATPSLPFEFTTTLLPLKLPAAPCPGTGVI